MTRSNFVKLLGAALLAPVAAAKAFAAKRYDWIFVRRRVRYTSAEYEEAVRQVRQGEWSVQIDPNRALYLESFDSHAYRR